MCIRDSAMGITEIFLNYYQYFLRGTQTTVIVSLITVLLGDVYKRQPPIFVIHLFYYDFTAASSQWTQERTVQCADCCSYYICTITKTMRICAKC